MRFDNILYIANYISSDVSSFRTNGKMFYAGNKKVDMVLELLKPLASKITVLSPTFTSGKSRVVYDRTRVETSSDGKVTFVYPLAVLGNILSFFLFIIYIVRLGLGTERSTRNLIVVYNSFFYTIIPGLILARLLRTRIVFEYEDVLYSAQDMHFVVRLFSLFFEKLVMNRTVDAFINVNSYMPNVDRSRRPVFVLQGLLLVKDHERTICMNRIDVGKRKLRLFYAGTVHRNRGIIQFLEMLRTIKDVDKLELTLVGPTKYNMSSELHTYSFAKYLGIVTDSELFRLTQLADICLVTQPIDRFALGSFPSKIFDYVLAGRPILSTPHPDAFRLRDTGYPIFFYSTTDDVESVFEDLLSRSSSEKGLTWTADITKFTLAYNEKLFIRFLDALGGK